MALRPGGNARPAAFVRYAPKSIASAPAYWRLGYIDCMLLSRHARRRQGAIGLGETNRHAVALPVVRPVAQARDLIASLEKGLQVIEAFLKEASSAGVLDGNHVLCVAALSTARIVSATLLPRTRVPAYCTSNSRVLLGALSDTEADACRPRCRPGST